jgi:hypothetical protein
MVDDAPNRRVSSWKTSPPQGVLVAFWLGGGAISLLVYRFLGPVDHPSLPLLLLYKVALSLSYLAVSVLLLRFIRTFHPWWLQVVPSVSLVSAVLIAIGALLLSGTETQLNLVVFQVQDSLSALVVVLMLSLLVGYGARWLQQRT